MDFFSYGIPIGRYFGINVRLHFTFLLYAFYRIQQANNVWLGLAFVVGVYVCILLHEFGHALAARWCDGEANDILLWPLGGLAFVRPANNPTAHLITTVCGPLVTLVLWVGLAALAWVLSYVPVVPFVVIWFVKALSGFNLFILLFNLIPAFPMDGGRILRDTLWHWMDAAKATAVAVVVSRVIAVAAGAYFLMQSNVWMLMFPVFIFMQTFTEQHFVAQAGRTDDFSIRERFKRGKRQRAFRQVVTEQSQTDAATPFHRCAACGVTDVESPVMDFRVCEECSTGQEYCREHLNAHKHS